MPKLEFTPADASEQSERYVKMHGRAVRRPATYYKELARIGRSEAAIARTPDSAKHHQEAADMWDKKAERETRRPEEQEVIELAKYAASLHPGEYFDAAVEQANKEGVHIDTNTHQHPKPIGEVAVPKT